MEHIQKYLLNRWISYFVYEENETKVPGAEKPATKNDRSSIIDIEDIAARFTNKWIETDNAQECNNPFTLVENY